ncbi:MAG: hypothetical protein KF888_05055, partial [Nitrosomonas sp.]|nr:hypothetical protein [Nitrosomonas sp.]
MSLLLLVGTSAVRAAQYFTDELSLMLDSARSKGVVRVMVTLDDTVSIEKMSDLDSIKPSLEIKAQQLLDVLGNDVFSYPVWNNRVGQIGVYVNENGLEKLK